MALILFHPGIASRSCADCQRYVFDDDPDIGGPVKLDRDELPMVRESYSETPCYRCPKTPSNLHPDKRTRATAVEMNERSMLAYQFYLECRAVGQFPNDPIVRLCAAAIRGVEDRYDRFQREKLSIQLETLFTILVTKTAGV